MEDEESVFVTALDEEGAAELVDTALSAVRQNWLQRVLGCPSALKPMLGSRFFTGHWLLSSLISSSLPSPSHEFVFSVPLLFSTDVVRTIATSIFGGKQDGED
jgi:hypothetical protein